MLLWASYVCGLTWCPGLLRWFTLLNGFMADYMETRRLFGFHAVEVVVQNRLRLVYAWQSACQFHHIRGQNMTKNPVPTDTVTIFSQPLPVTSGKPENGSKPVSSWQKQYQNLRGPFWDHSWVPVLHHEGMKFPLVFLFTYAWGVHARSQPFVSPHHWWLIL